MLKDDRMMGMLTFVVIMLAFGTFIQRAEVFERLFPSDAPPPELALDEATARATKPVVIDVLANDAEVAAADAAKLVIVTPPDCGQAFVREGRIHYLGGPECVGAQTVRYGLGGEQTAALRIAVAASDNKSRPVKPPANVAPPPSGGPTPPAELRSKVRVGALPGSGAEDAVAATGGPATRTDPAGPEPADPPAAPVESDPGAERARTDAPGDNPTPTGTSGPDRADASPPAVAATGPALDASGGDTARGPCTPPPTLTLDTAPGAMTTVSVDSPCHAGTVAELAYDGLRFAIRLDAEGIGSLTAPGFQRTSEATLTLEEHEPMTFSLPFRDIERIERVAVAWQAAEGLALNAFEFGARPGSAGHVRPDAPRSFEAVRRDGGGWLSSYAPAGGKGQRIEVYSFWRRYAGPSGVIRLGLDPGRPGEGCAGATATGADYEVLRSHGGRLERTRLGRIGAIDCTRLAGGAGQVIGDAVDDLIVRRR